MRLILIRHGEIEGIGSVHKYQGRADRSLSQAGAKQAEALAGRLKEEPISVIYSSGLKRTIETAMAIARPHNLPVNPWDCFNEIDFGDWEGKSLEEIKEKDPEIYRKWLNGEEFSPPGGESVSDLKHRVIKGLEVILKRKAEGTTLLAAHGGPIKIILAHFLGLSQVNFWAIAQDLAALNIIDFFEGRPMISLLNDTCHCRGY